MIRTQVMSSYKKELKVNTNDHKIFPLHYHLQGDGDVLSLSLCGLYFKWFSQLTYQYISFINQYCFMKKRYLFPMMDLRLNKVINSKLMNLENAI